MTDNRRVVVTGGAGFIGSHVADAYLGEGYSVTIIDDLSSGRRENVPNGAELVVCDIRSPEARKVVAEGNFSVINHHAAQMDVRVSVEDPELDASTNIMGLLNLLEAGRGRGLERVVFASSGGVVYGESEDLPHAEIAPKMPVSPYGVSKLSSEYYLSAYAMLYGLSVASLRYANVYGPRQNPHGEAGVVAIFGSRIRDGRALTVYGDGSQTRDYVFVKDVARANVAATKVELGDSKTIDDLGFNVGTARETSVKQLADIMISAAGKSVEIENAPARTGELQRSAVDPSKARELMGWEPGVTLEEGLKETYDWIVESK